MEAAFEEIGLLLTDLYVIITSTIFLNDLAHSVTTFHGIRFLQQVIIQCCKERVRTGEVPLNEIVVAFKNLGLFLTDIQSAILKY
jgi:hypothetical protein